MVVQLNPCVVFCDPDPTVLESARTVFDPGAGVDVLTCSDPKAVLAYVRHTPISMVLVGTGGGAEPAETNRLLEELHLQHPNVELAVLTSSGSFDGLRQADGSRVDLPQVGKPWQDEGLRQLILEQLDARIARGAQEPLLQDGRVTEPQLRLARRVAGRMETPLPLGEILVELGEITREELQEVEQRGLARMSMVEILLQGGHLTSDQAKHYIDQKRANPDVDDFKLLVEPEIVSEEVLVRALSLRFRIPYVEPSVTEVDGRFLERASFKYLLRKSAIPLGEINDRLQVVVSRPLDMALRADLSRTFERPIEILCSSSEKIQEALRTLERLKSRGEISETAKVRYQMTGDTPVQQDQREEAVQIVDYLILRAIQLGASDLHLEPGQESLLVRVRVDGALRVLSELPRAVMSRVISRIKVLASIDISERRMHQDGRIVAFVGETEIDIRVSAYASVFGQTLVLRVLNRSRGLLSLSELGIVPRIQSMLEDVVLPASTGLVMISGPTGSGKTTTMYSLLKHCWKPTEKVISAEDPRRIPDRRRRPMLRQQPDGADLSRFAPGNAASGPGHDRRR